MRYCLLLEGGQVEVQQMLWRPMTQGLIAGFSALGAIRWVSCVYMFTSCQTTTTLVQFLQFGIQEWLICSHSFYW